MKTKITLAIFLVSLLFLTACSSNSTQQTTSGFIGGTNGLVASFVTGSPPNQVFDGNQPPFSITLLLQNEGEHDILPGDVLTTIDSIDYGTFQISNPNQQNQDSIPGESRGSTGQLSPGGQSTSITYSASYKPTVPASEPFTIGMNVCYKYVTQAITKLCLEQAVTSRPGPNDVCKIEDQKVVSNSAGPIQITGISERPSGPNQVTIIVEVTNKGAGEVYGPSYLSGGKCVSSTDPTALNNVQVIIGFPDNEASIQCSQFGGTNSGILRLVQGQQRFDCTINTGNLQNSIFEKQVNVQASYVYRNYLSQQIVVESSSQ